MWPQEILKMGFSDLRSVVKTRGLEFDFVPISLHSHMRPQSQLHYRQVYTKREQKEGENHNKASQMDQPWTPEQYPSPKNLRRRKWTRERILRTQRPGLKGPNGRVNDRGWHFIRNTYQGWGAPGMRRDITLLAYQVGVTRKVIYSYIRKGWERDMMPSQARLRRGRG